MAKLTYKSLLAEFFDKTIRVNDNESHYLRVRIYPTYPSRNTYLVIKESIAEYLPFTEKGLRQAIKAFNSESK